MCGIHGFLGNNTEKIKTMIDIARHRGPDGDRKSTRLNSSHVSESRMPSSA